MNNANHHADATFGVKRARLSQFWQPKYWPVYVGLGLLQLLLALPERLRRLTLLGLGRVAFYVARRERRVTLINLRLVYPTATEAHRRVIAKAHFVSLVTSLFEVGLVWFKPAADLRARVQVQGIEHLQNGLANGRGVLLLGAHFTTNEIAAAALGLLELPLDVMYRPTEHPLIQELALRGRSRWSGRLIPNNQFVELLRALKANRIVLFAPDQRYTGDGALVVPLFGVPALSNPGTTLIHRATRCCVLMYSQKRLSNGHYQMCVHPPIADYPGQDASADIATYHRFIESAVNAAPEQYLWSYKRFKGLASDSDPYRR